MFPAEVSKGENIFGKRPKALAFGIVGPLRPTIPNKITADEGKHCEAQNKQWRVGPRGFPEGGNSSMPDRGGLEGGVSGRMPPCP